MKRSRASVVLGVLSTVLVVLLVGAATERTSPGRIASVHGRIAELDGGQACAKCHGGWFGDMQGACLDCHPAIAKQLAERRGLHGTLPPAQAGHCAECHGEHHGDAFRLVNKLAFAQAGVPDPQRFDHARVGYTMAGAHLALTCAECHPHADAELVPEGAQRFLGLRQDCASCHGDPHQGRMRFACTTCHDQIAFEAIVVPGHEQWLPLDGAHVAVGCRQCHVAGSPHALEALQPGRHQQARQCADCHAAPHGQPFLLGNAGDAGVAPAAVCAQCHRLDLPRFADLRVTVTPAQHAHGGFPLQAPHAGLVCAVCHLPGASYAERHPGRGPDDCAACHGDAHGGQFATGPFAAAGCRGCHAATHWTPHEFDLAHHARTALPLEGRHATGACNGCHAEPPAGEPRRFRGTPHRCEACHDDAHRGAFAHAEAKLQAAPRGSCALCHGAEAFATLAHDRFDHRDWTGFPLDGAHAQIECTDCHARTETPDQFGRRFGRVHGTVGTATDCTTCHGDPHRGTFATGALPALVDGRESCLRCHDTASFRALPHGFDHAAATGFALSGAHAELA